MSMYTQIKFNGKIVQKLFILKLEPDLDPEPEKRCEHGPWSINEVFQVLTDGRFCTQYFIGFIITVIVYTISRVRHAWYTLL